MLQSLRRAGLIWPTALSLAGLAVLIGLGTWQLNRKQWKDGLIAKIAERVAARAGAAFERGKRARSRARHRIPARCSQGSASITTRSAISMRRPGGARLARLQPPLELAPSRIAGSKPRSCRTP